jgi:hypothetical protein
MDVQSALMWDLKIEKLSDEFGQYLIYLSCPCGHIRRCNPHTLAAFAGWDATLAKVVKRLRCSKCNQRKCTARTVEPTKPRGYRDVVADDGCPGVRSR